MDITNLGSSFTRKNSKNSCNLKVVILSAMFFKNWRIPLFGFPFYNASIYSLYQSLISYRLMKKNCVFLTEKVDFNYSSHCQKFLIWFAMNTSQSEVYFVYHSSGVYFIHFLQKLSNLIFFSFIPHGQCCELLTSRTPYLSFHSLFYTAKCIE